MALRLRYLERVPLGTPYPEVVERVAQVTRSAELAGRCHLVVDATGVGRPVVDLLRRARLGCVVMPVMITGGETGDASGRVLPGAEAGPDCGAAGAAASGGLQIAAGLEYGPDAGEGDDGDAGEGDARGARAVRGVAGGDARRPGVGGGAGVLERAEGVSERSGGRGAVVDEQARRGRGADIAAGVRTKRKMRRNRRAEDLVYEPRAAVVQGE